MGREKRKSNNVESPARFMVDLQNGGEITIYDRVEKKKGENLEVLELYYLAQVWFWYKVKLDGANKVMSEWVSGFYTSGSDKINLYYKDYLKKSESNSQRGIVDDLRDLKSERELSTGSIVFATDGKGNIYQVKMSATAMYHFGQFKESLKEEPDFSVSMRAAVKEDKTKSKNVPEFSHWEPDTSEEVEQAIEDAHSKCMDYINKKIGKIAEGAKTEQP